MQDRIAQAVRLRLDDAKAREQINDTDAEADRSHFLNEFASARETLEPGEEAELAEFAIAHLAAPDQPLKRYSDR